MEDRRALRRRQLLDGEQLINFGNRLQCYSIETKGQKLDASDYKRHEKEEKEEEINQMIESNAESLRRRLTLERILLSNKRSRGVYEEEGNRVQMSAVLGKFSWLGYMDSKIMYLKPHEALLLIEMNRLDVSFNGVVLSVEEAHAMFVDGSNDLSLGQYLVYSNLMRIGYGVAIHDPESDRQKYRTLNDRNRMKIQDEIVWSVLFRKLNLPYDRTLVVNNQELYHKAKADMVTHQKAISGAERRTTGSIAESSSDDEPPLKKRRHERETKLGSFLDVLKSELEFLAHEQTFRQLNRVGPCLPDNNTPDACDWRFTFDVYLPKAQTKRSEQLADYRVLVPPTACSLPSNVQLAALKKRQAYEAPIIIASVSESMSVHYSLCTF